MKSALALLALLLTASAFVPGASAVDLCDHGLRVPHPDPLDTESEVYVCTVEDDDASDGHVVVVFWRPAACWDPTVIGPVSVGNCANAAYVAWDA